MDNFHLIKVTGFPDAKENSVIPHKDRLLVYTTSPATNRYANKAIQALLAEYFAVPIQNVILIKGSASPSKLFKIYPTPHGNIA